MKQLLYALMAFCAFGLLSCRKSSDNFTIKQFDEDQIKQYMNNNGLTSVMKRDTSGGDTTGIYYQILDPGPSTKVAIKYSDLVSFVYTDKTFDGKYVSADTIFNHAYTYAGYVAPNGLQLAIKNIAKNFGTKIRVLIPSRLMYGINGTTLQGYNPSTNAATYSNIVGNQCFDYTINVIDPTKQDAYDDLSVVKYMAASGLTGQYTKTSSGLWYRIIQQGTGTDVINMNSTVGVQYTGTLLNGSIFDQFNATDGTSTSFSMYDLFPAWQEALPKVTAGAKLSILSPSRLGKGQQASAASQYGPVPAFSCMRFDINVMTVTN